MIKASFTHFKVEHGGRRKEGGGMKVRTHDGVEVYISDFTAEYIILFVLYVSQISIGVYQTWCVCVCVCYYSFFPQPVCVCMTCAFVCARDLPSGVCVVAVFGLCVRVCPCLVCVR